MGGDRLDIRDDLVIEQTRKLRIENDLVEKNLIDMDLAVQLVQSLAGTVVSELANWSNRVTRDPAQRVAIDREVRRSLDRIRKKETENLMELLRPLNGEDEQDDDADQQ